MKEQFSGLMRATVAAGLVALASIVTFGQTAPLPFEVTTVKPSESNGSGIGNRFLPDRMSYTNATLRVLIGAAYNVRDYQITGAPDWINTEKWDVAGKTETPLPAAGRFGAMLRMLQTLLEDRFQLRFHRETKELPIYSLVIGKNGHKLREFKEGDANARLRTPQGEISGEATMRTLAFFLDGQMNRPVRDKTGLEGLYVFSLKYTPDYRVFEPPGDEPPAPDPNRPSLFTAVQEQLGLRLEAQKGPVEIMVIDQVRRPSEN